MPTIDRVTKTLSGTRLHRTEALAMVKHRARSAGIATPGICNHTFRGSGITSYLGHPDARLEVAQYMAGHADPKTTRIYDRRQEIVTLDEVERIGI
jgi:integrase